MKLSRFTIFILSLTLVTLLSWIFFQVYRFQKRGVTFDPIDTKYTQPLNPQLDPGVLEQLENRNN